MKQSKWNRLFIITLGIMIVLFTIYYIMFTLIEGMQPYLITNKELTSSYNDYYSKGFIQN
jgi:uncharacterized protein YpmS